LKEIEMANATNPNILILWGDDIGWWNISYNRGQMGPTATARQLGTGRWSAGPTAALIYSKGPWFNGVLAYQLMSFAGNRRRGSVNVTYIEPTVSYNFEGGWYAQIDPPISYDWTADIKDAWVLPVGADIGKAFNMGPQAFDLQLGSCDFLKIANVSASTTC
jgi:hypothetical protein